MCACVGVCGSVFVCESMFVYESVFVCESVLVCASVVCWFVRVYSYECVRHVTARVFLTPDFPGSSSF